MEFCIIPLHDRKVMMIINRTKINKCIGNVLELLLHGMLIVNIV
jgi:hypothetical protein